MAEPTSILDFPGLVTRVSREAGIAYYGPSGDQKALPPIDIHDLELVKEIVNDGIRMFCADAPNVGWRWPRRIASVTLAGTRVTGTVDSVTADPDTLTDATLEATYDTDDDLVGYWCYILTGTGKGSYAQITDYTASGGVITVADWLDQYGQAAGTDPVAADTFAITDVEVIGGDIARYPLPEGFCGEVSGEIHYAKDTANATRIQWSHESEIRSRRAASVSSGAPSRAAIRPWEPQTGTLSYHAKRRWELIVDPEPTAGDVLEFPYEIIFDKLDMEAGVGTTGTGADNLTDSTRAEGDDYFNGWVIEIVAGTGRGSYAVVDDYTGDSGKFDIVDDDWLTAAGKTGGTHPDTTSVYIVQPANNLHPAGAKFDEAIKAACLAEAEMRIDDISANWMQKYVQKALNRRGRVVRERIWKDVTHS